MSFGSFLWTPRMYKPATNQQQAFLGVFFTARLCFLTTSQFRKSYLNNMKNDQGVISGNGEVWI